MTTSSSSRAAPRTTDQTETLWTRKLTAFQHRLENDDPAVSHVLSRVHAHAGYADTGAALIGLLLGRDGRPVPAPRVWSVPRRASIGPAWHPELDLVLYAERGTQWCRTNARGELVESEADRVEREASRTVEHHLRESEKSRFAYDWHVLYGDRDDVDDWFLVYARNPWHAFVKPDFPGDDQRWGVRPGLEYVGSWSEFRDLVAAGNQWQAEPTVRVDAEVPESARPDDLCEVLKRGSW